MRSHSGPQCNNRKLRNDESDHQNRDLSSVGSVRGSVVSPLLTPSSPSLYFLISVKNTAKKKKAKTNKCICKDPCGCASTGFLSGPACCCARFLRARASLSRLPLVLEVERVLRLIKVDAVVLASNLFLYSARSNLSLLVCACTPRHQTANELVGSCVVPTCFPQLLACLLGCFLLIIPLVVKRLQ